MPTLLIVDDAEDYSAIAQNALSLRSGMYCARALPEALERIQDTALPALLDVRLSEEDRDNRDGLATAAHPASFPNIPVVMMSAYRLRFRYRGAQSRIRSLPQGSLLTSGRTKGTLVSVPAGRRASRPSPPSASGASAPMLIQLLANVAMNGCLYAIPRWASLSSTTLPVRSI